MTPRMNIALARLDSRIDAAMADVRRQLNARIERLKTLCMCGSAVGLIVGVNLVSKTASIL
jgi:hypothetical protein